MGGSTGAQGSTIRQQIITAITTCMETILTGGGYSSDLGLNVYPWRTDDLAAENDELPAIVFRDLTEEAIPIEEVPYGKHEFKLTLEIWIVCEEGETTPEEMRLMIADVMKAVGTNQTWGGLALWTEPMSDEIKVVEEKLEIGTARITFNILYRTARYDPFNS